jgi:hypothetical protein
MVARPPNYQELQRQANNSAPSVSSQNSMMRNLEQSIQDTINSLAGIPALSLSNNAVGVLQLPLRSDPALRQNAAAPSSHSLEHIRQDLLTLHTLLSTMNIVPDDLVSVPNRSLLNSNLDLDSFHRPDPFSTPTSSSIRTSNQNRYQFSHYDVGDGLSSSLSSSSSSLSTPSGKKFFLGQWLDVKDTVNQWLEATVMDINVEESKALIHYNGWPVRWDEWIAFDSPRIAPFRTRTLHSSNGPYSSPSPNSAVSNAPVTGRDDVRALIPEVSLMMTRISPALSELAALSQSVTPISHVIMPYQYLMLHISLCILHDYRACYRSRSFTTTRRKMPLPLRRACHGSPRLQDPVMRTALRVNLKSEEKKVIQNKAYFFIIIIKNRFY